ncbi:hybrid sensor histidine kinase/response regulator transcription factor [Mucilaginibacter paludis]|uniref:histidine kinase n=1 Tax=Mucilaginibacter paludis DSM 18603 TaxID=714943 RepID=H1YDS1_9SPHI|nr:two-component regulator propeller domain-containing protein [Mucilaginibacter paludis]EHQ30760.1 histidine kinase [Mucilaginibacter paludis DSM 18603]
MIKQGTIAAFFLMIAFLPCYAHAQQPAIRFRHISYKDGLVQSPISTILQDKSGYVWIGSWAGLSRYDGSYFKNFRPNDSSNTSISHNRINRIIQDAQGHLWIGTGGGLNLYDSKTEKFRHVGLSSAKGGGNFITAIQQDHSGKIWVATFNGIKSITSDLANLISIDRWKNKENELFKGVAFSLAEDDKQTIWAGINQGLKRFNPQNAAVIPLPDILRSQKELLSAKVIVITADHNGSLWFGTESDGIFRYNERLNSCTHYVNKANDIYSLPSNWINDLLIKDGNVWAATRNGLAILNPQTNTFTNYKHDPDDSRTMSDGSVWSLMTDHTGNVWLGTYSGGLNLYYPGNSNFVNIGERVGNNIGLSKSLAEAIVGDADGGLWIGSFGGGLNYINRQKGLVSYFPASEEIKALVKDSVKNLWAGTLNGLFKFNHQNKTFGRISLETFNNKTAARLINALLPAKRGIWVGTNGAGLRLVDYQGKEILRLRSEPGAQIGLSDNYVNCLLNDGSKLWIGTQNGLNCYDQITQQIKYYRRKNSGLGNNNVLCLYMDNHKRLWIGTDGGGLNYLDEPNNRIYAIRQADGLIDDVIAAIVADKQGALWISTNNGISQLKLVREEFPLKRGDYQIANYTAADGLQSNQFLVNSAYQTAQGEILFGGMNGITAFFPDKIVKNKFKPDILLTGFYISNKEVSFGNQSYLKLPLNETSELTLPYNQNNFTIKFSALNFINPEKNVYAYKMTGLRNNDQWIITGNQKEAGFTNLAPGHYVFTVKAANNDGYWNEKGRTITINILPPLWETWWAYCFYALVVAFLFYKVIRFVQIRAALERDLYNEHLQNERQEEFYQMKLDFFTNISHEIRTPLTLIMGPVENLYNNTMDNPFISRQVLQIKNNAERLLRLMTELMDFRKAETGNMVLYVQYNNIVGFIKEIYLSFTTLAESRHISYQFTSNLPEIYLYTDNEQLEKVFFNLLSNAFKFTPDYGCITVELQSNEQYGLTINIADNGQGIPAEYQSKLFTNFYQVHSKKSNQGTGVGLALSKSIVELHQGTIAFKSSPQQVDQPGDTVFTVHLPVNFKPVNNVHIISDNSGIESVASFRMRAEIDVLNQEEHPNGGQKGTIILAEDNEELRNFIVDSLPGYEVAAYENGHVAFEQAITQIPDLVISDVMMPVMNGLELCRKIKTDERTSHIPVILLTALATHIHQVNGLQTGADVYLTKPFSIKLLELNVQNLLTSRELMRNKFSQQVILHPQQVVLNNPDEKFIQKLMATIEHNMENPEFGVIALGAEIGMSKSVLYKKICALTNLSPADFIKSMRLKKAADLLQQNSLSVNEVASMVGFNDRKYFSREFKKIHGKSPSEMNTPASAR